MSSTKEKALNRDKDPASSEGQATKVNATPVSQMRPEITGSSPDPLSTPSAKVSDVLLSSIFIGCMIVLPMGVAPRVYV